jgi:hypothetical protein
MAMRFLAQVRVPTWIAQIPPNNNLKLTEPKPATLIRSASAALPGKACTDAGSQE